MLFQVILEVKLIFCHWNSMYIRFSDSLFLEVEILMEMIVYYYACDITKARTTSILGSV